jgi:hypothetical protein
LTFARTADPPDPLLEQVPQRATNRKLGERLPLEEGDERALREVAQIAGARLQLLVQGEGLTRIGEIVGKGDRLRFLSEAMHREMMRELRWTPEEVEATRDGVDVATLELSAADRAGLGVLSCWPVLAHLRHAGAGRALEQPARRAIAAACAVGLLTIEGTGPASFFLGGRAVQRLWLTATARRIAFHPLTALPYLFARLERGNGEGLTGEEQEMLAALRADYLELFEVPPGHAEIMLFRLADAGPPRARSLRRNLDEVLFIL